MIRSQQKRDRPPVKTTRQKNTAIIILNLCAKPNVPVAVNYRIIICTPGTMRGSNNFITNSKIKAAEVLARDSKFSQRARQLVPPIMLLPFLLCLLHLTPHKFLRITHHHPQQLQIPLLAPTSSNSSRPVANLSSQTMHHSFHYITIIFIKTSF